MSGGYREGLGGISPREGFSGLVTDQITEVKAITSQLCSRLTAGILPFPASLSLSRTSLSNLCDFVILPARALSG